jgi:hypothetical protein
MQFEKMKQIITATCLLILTAMNSSGQWYVRKYNVSDINFLTREQLEQSLLNSKDKLAGAAIFTGIGGALVLGGIYALHHEPDEEASIIDEILSSDFMGKTYIVAGTGIAIGGAIACFTYLGRIGRIKLTIYDNFPSQESLTISPVIIRNYYNRSNCPAFRVTYTF